MLPCTARSPTSPGRGRGTFTSQSRMIRRRFVPSSGRTKRGGSPSIFPTGSRCGHSGGVSVYPPRGEYQIVVSHLEPEGIGALELAFRQRYARLLQEGLFDPARKRPLPRYPRVIVIVSSPTGAAVRDVLQVTGRRWRCARMLIAPTRVQGAGADQEVAAAIALANQVDGCRPDHRRPRRRQPGRPLDVQRGNRRPRDRRHRGCRSSRPSATKST